MQGANDFQNRLVRLLNHQSGLRIYDILIGSSFFSTSACRRREKLPCVYNIHKLLFTKRPKVYPLTSNFSFFDTNTASGMGGRPKCIPGAPLFPSRPRPSSRRSPHPCPVRGPSPFSQPIFTPLLQLGSILDRLTYWKKFENVLSLTEGLPKVSKNFLEACRYSCAAVFAVLSGVARKTPAQRLHARPPT